MQDQLNKIQKEIADISALVVGLTVAQIKKNNPIIVELGNKIDVLQSQLDTVSKNTKEETSSIKDELYPQFEALKKSLEDKLTSFKVATPKDGYTPVKGVDYFDGEDGKTPTKEELVSLIEPLIPAPVEVKTEVIKEVVSPETGETIVEKINALDTNEDVYKIDFKYIKNVPDFRSLTRPNGGGWRNLYQLADVNIQSPTNGQALVYNSTTNLWENGGGGGTGTITGSGTATQLAYWDTSSSLTSTIKLNWYNTNQQLAIGEATGFNNTANTPLSVGWTGNTYGGVYVQNQASAITDTSASGDIIIGADNDGVAATGHFINMGINNSNYNGVLGVAGDGYIYTSGGNQHIGTDTVSKVVNIFTGGLTSSNIRVVVSDTTVTTSVPMNVPRGGTNTGYLFTGTSGGGMWYAAATNHVSLGANSASPGVVLAPGVTTLSDAGGGGTGGFRISVTGSNQLTSTGSLRWANSGANNYSGTIDTGISRSAAGVVQINNGTAGTLRDLSARNIISGGVVRLQGYTVATLPLLPVIGDMAYCTDLFLPAYGAIAVGGGAVVLPVFFNGLNWVT